MENADTNTQLECMCDFSSFGKLLKWVGIALTYLYVPKVDAVKRCVTADKHVASFFPPILRYKYLSN